MDLQLLLLIAFAIAGFLLFVGLLTFLELDQLLLQNQQRHARATPAPTAANSVALAARPCSTLPAMVALRRVSLTELQKANAHFCQESLLHAGSSADIFLGSLSSADHDYELVAIKRFEPAPITSPDFDPFFTELLLHISTSLHHHLHKEAPTSVPRPLPKLITILSPPSDASSSPRPCNYHESIFRPDDNDAPPPSQSQPVDGYHHPCLSHPQQPSILSPPPCPYSPGSLTQHPSSVSSHDTASTSSTPSSALRQDVPLAKYTTSYKNMIFNEDPPMCSYIMPLLAYCVEKQERLLVYEYAPNKDLDTAMQVCRQSWVARQRHTCTPSPDNNVDFSHGPCLASWSTRLKIATQVAEALVFLHHSCQPPIAHRGLKASSILLTSNFDARLASLKEASTLGEGELPLYDIYCFGQLLVYLIVGVNVKDTISTKDFLETLSMLNGSGDCITSHTSLFPLIDPSMMLEEDFSMEVLGVALVARACVQIKASRSLTMAMIRRFLRDPTKAIRELN